MRKTRKSIAEPLKTMIRIRTNAVKVRVLKCKPNDAKKNKKSTIHVT